MPCVCSRPITLSRVEAEALFERINGHTVGGGMDDDVYGPGDLKAVS